MLGLTTEQRLIAGIRTILNELRFPIDLHPLFIEYLSTLNILLVLAAEAPSTVEASRWNAAITHRTTYLFNRTLIQFYQPETSELALANDPPDDTEFAFQQHITDWAVSDHTLDTWRTSRTLDSPIPDAKEHPRNVCKRLPFFLMLDRERRPNSNNKYMVLRLAKIFSPFHAADVETTPYQTPISTALDTTDFELLDIILPNWHTYRNKNNKTLFASAFDNTKGIYASTAIKFLEKLAEVSTDEKQELEKKKVFTETQPLVEKRFHQYEQTIRRLQSRLSPTVTYWHSLTSTPEIDNDLETIKSCCFLRQELKQIESAYEKAAERLTPLDKQITARVNHLPNGKYQFDTRIFIKLCLLSKGPKYKVVSAATEPQAAPKPPAHAIAPPATHHM